MTTAEALEKITDRGKFELLATSVLRQINTEYSSLVHTGMNSAGETVVSPVDGFCRLPHSNPPHYIMVAHTTTERDDLNKKWLHDHSTVRPRKPTSSKPSPADDGDLLKAGRQAL